VSPPAEAPIGPFLDALRRCKALSPEQAAHLGWLAKEAPGPRELARELLARKWITAYQANQLLQGRGDELTLGPYVLLERLGEGGMGQVFKAIHAVLRRVVALKVVRKDRSRDPELLRRFEREVRAAGILSHPNIVLATDAALDRGACFLVMEFVEGRDLVRVVREQGPLPHGLACDCVVQAALGLQHAHERGLVHRDIKPGNLLLDTSGVLKVLDLGLARILGAQTELITQLTGEGAVMGTPDYMAPEQAEEPHTVDIRADVYSLGCTLYFLLSGRVPFPGGTAMQKMRRHQTAEPDPLEAMRPDVPAALLAVLRRMMAKRPEDRYSTPAEVATALAPFRTPWGPNAASPDATQMSVATALAGVTPPAVTPVIGKPWPWWPALVGVGVLLLSLVFFWPRSRPPEGPPIPKEEEEEREPTLELKPEQRPYDKVPLLVGVLGEHRLSHPEMGNLIAADPTGKYVAVGHTRSPLVRVGRLDTLRREFDLYQPNQAVGTTQYGLAFSPDGKWLALSSTAGLVLWSMARPGDRPRVFPPAPIKAARFSPDSKTAYVVAGNEAVGIDVITGKRVLVLRAPDKPKTVTAGIIPSPRGDVLLYLIQVAEPDGGKGTFRYGTVASLLSLDGKPKAKLPQVFNPQKKARRVGGDFFPDGKRVLLWGNEGMWTWDVGATELVRLHKDIIPYTEPVHFTSDRKQLAILRPLPTRKLGEALFLPLDRPDMPLFRTLHITALAHGIALHPDSTHLLVSDGQFVTLWDGNTGRRVSPPARPEFPAERLFPLGGKGLLGLSRQTPVRYDVSSGEVTPLPLVWSGAGPASFSPDGSLFAGNYNAPKDRLAILDYQEWRELFHVPARDVVALAFRRTKPRPEMLTLDSVGMLAGWGLKESNVANRTWRAPLGLKKGETIYQAWFSPDASRFLAAVGPSKPPQTQLLQFDADGKKEGEITYNPTTVVFSADGKTAYIGTQKGGLERCVLGESPLRGTTVHSWHSGSAVRALALAPDGKHLFSADATGRAIVWRLGQPVTEPPAAQWRQQANPIVWFAALPDGRMAALTADGPVYLLRVPHE
jgi:WD40 repeat protein